LTDSVTRIGVVPIPSWT
jgi:hypothetical protein